MNMMQIDKQFDGALPSLVPAGFTLKAEKGLSRLVRVGLAIIAVLVFGFGGLIAFLPIAGAVISPGEITVETNVKEISHPFGGVVSDILVRDGDQVKKGQVLIRLDSTVSGAAAEYTGLSLYQLLARGARLRAIQTGAIQITFPDELLTKADDPGVKTAMDDERRGFELARAAKADQLRQLQARIAQSRAQIATYASRANAYSRQEALVSQELAQTRQLYEGRLTTLDRLNALERAAVGVQADHASAKSGISQASAQISELQVQMASVQSEARANAAAELVQVQAAISDSRKQDVAATDQNDRTAIRAPQDGTVDKLAIRTLGSVVPAGETLVQIIPSEDRLVVRAHVGLEDIEQVTKGQMAHLRFSSLSMRTTPELAGTVTHVAADRTVDRATNTAYYIATVSIAKSELEKLGDVRLSVGIPVEVFIQTEERTILQYILRPLVDQLKRALRE